MRRQLFVLFLVAASFPFLYFSLELPKRIINKAIGGANFPQPFMGMEFQQIEYLFVLCGMFLAMVLINGGFKYWINVAKGQLGERMLRRLRYELYSRVLRFPLPRFRKMSQGEIISMITAEVDPLGGFIGDALALPAFQGGTLLTILVFMFIQDPFLGGAAVAFYPVQIYLIPRLQKRVNLLSRERVRNVRKLSERIGETVTGISEIHAHDTSEFELADFSGRLGTIYGIRYEIYRRKFMIKFLNNFIAQVTPFFFFSIGGYLVIKGDLTFGALVAVLAAYKDLASPWRELLSYYQSMEDIKTKYGQIMDQFQPADMMEESLQRTEPDSIMPPGGTAIMTNLTLEEEGGIKVVDGINATLELNGRIAVIGAEGSGSDGLALLLARLLSPTAGSIKLGGRNLSHLPESVTGRRIAYVGQNAGLFAGTVRDNLVYGLKHRPAVETAEDEKRLSFMAEAEAAGNSLRDINADWIDYQAAGASCPEELTARIFQVLEAVCLKDDIYDFGLQGSINPLEKPRQAAAILDARAKLRRRLNEPGPARPVEPFDRSRYNVNMTVSENLLFGTPIGNEFNLERLGENAYVQATLEKVGLGEDFLKTAVKLAALMVELFRNMEAGHEFFERFSFIGADDLPEVQHCLSRSRSGSVADLEPSERNLLMSLLFKIVPERHRLGLIDEDMQQRLLEARRAFAENLPEGLRGSVAFFDEKEYNAASSIQDNILFGKLVYGRPQGKREVGGLIREVIESMGLTGMVLEAGMDSPVGVGGARLSGAQRQKLAIARCLLKRPGILIVNAAAAALDQATRKTIMDNVFREVDGRGLVWVLDQADQAARFDYAVIMEGGKIIEQGSVKELKQPGRPLHFMAPLEEEEADRGI